MIVESVEKEAYKVREVHKESVVSKAFKESKEFKVNEGREVSKEFKV